MALTQGFSNFSDSGQPVNNLFIHGTPELHCLFLESNIILHYVHIHIFPPELWHVNETFPSVKIRNLQTLEPGIPTLGGTFTKIADLQAHNARYVVSL